MFDVYVIGNFPMHDKIRYKRDEVFPIKITDNRVCTNFHLTEESVLGIIIQVKQLQILCIARPD